MADPIDEALARAKKAAGVEVTEADIDAALIRARGTQPLPEMNEEQFLAASVNQPKLGQAGLDSGMTRTLLAFHDNPEEMQLAFKKAFPEGELRFVDVPADVYFSRDTIYPSGQTPAGQRIALFRRSRAEPFARLDAPALEWEDVADVAGATPGVALDIGAAFLTRGRSLPLQIAGQAGGAAAGEGLKQLGQTAAGTQAQTLGEQLTEAATQAGAAGVGGLLSTGISAPYNVAKGAGLTGAKPGAEAAQQAATDLRLPELLPHQVSDQPLLATIARQVQRTSPLINRRVAQQEEAALGKMEGLRRPLDLVSLNVNLDRAYKDETQRLTNLIATKPITTAEAGKELQEGLVKWNKLAGESVTQKYEYARSLDQPMFDIRPVQQVAADIHRGTFARGNRRIKTPRGVIKPDVNVGAEPSGELKGVIQKIMAMDPNVRDVPRRGRVSLSTDQIKALMEQLYALKTPAFGQGMDYNQKLAGDLWHALNKVLDEPIGGSPQFKAAWNDARTAAKERFAMRDAMVALISATDREFAPHALASRLMQPGNHDAIKLARDLLYSKGLGNRWETLGDAFVSKLVREPAKIDSALTSFDKETLDLILPEARQLELRYFAGQMGKLEETGIRNALKHQTNATAAMGELLERGHSAAIDELANLAGGPNSQLGKSLRAGVIDYIYQHATRNVDGVLRIDQKALNTILNRLDETTASSLLTASDRRVLRQLDEYLAFARPTGDVGAALQAASLGAGIVRLSSDAILSVMHNLGVGRFLLSKAGKAILAGQSRPRANPVSLRLLGSTVAQITKEMQKDDE